jgi:hypothetical protein
MHTRRIAWHNRHCNTRFWATHDLVIHPSSNPSCLPQTGCLPPLQKQPRRDLGPGLVKPYGVRSLIKFNSIRQLRLPILVSFLPTRTSCERRL